MNDQIADEIKKSTTKCMHFLSCLDCLSKDKPACKVEIPFGENLMFVKGSGADLCPYHHIFENSYICKCPIHYALWPGYSSARENQLAKQSLMLNPR
jgi:hypothetical protein